MNCCKYLILLCFVTLVSASLNQVTAVLMGGIVFADSGQNLGNEYSNDIALGDLDGDGDADAFVSNSQNLEVWLNQGGEQGGIPGIFVESGQKFGDIANEAVALGDVDGDGDLDAYVIRGGSIDSHQIWINQGGQQGGQMGVFLQSGHTVSDNQSSNIVLGDVDGDNDLDAYITRYFSSDLLYINDGAGNFNDSGQNLEANDTSGAALADLDGDDDLDIFTAVENGGNTVWINQGGLQGGLEGVFADSGQVLAGGQSLNVALGDVDNDNDLDAFVANTAENIVWINQGGDQGGTPGTFQFNGQLLGFSASTDVQLADLDDDNDLDAFVAEFGANTVWVNQGGDQGGTLGQFADSGLSLGNELSSGVALADGDGDGDTDAFVANSGNSPNKVYVNQQVGPTAVFVTNGQQLGNAHSYDVAVGDLDGNGHLDAFVANDGANKVWLNDACAQFSDSEQALGDANSFAVALGDVDGDNDLDAFVANNGANKVWLNDGFGVFSDSGQALGSSISWGVALGDVDDDGDLDAFVANTLVNKVWLNGEDGDPLGVFSSRNVGNSFSQDVALGDTDLDGDLDAFVVNSGLNAHYYNLDGLGDFVGSSLYGRQADSYGVALGDLDNDGFPDAFIANGGITRTNEIWLNDDNYFGTFSDSLQRLGDGSSQDVGLADLDGDGDLDAFVANMGIHAANKVWLNDGVGVFTDSGLELGQALSRAVALADFDHDGDVDAFVANQGANRVWLNSGRGGGESCQCIVEWLSAREEARSIQTWQQQLLDVGLFYGVRDELLGQTALGQHYIDLYYVHDPEILALLVTHATLREEGTAVLSLWQSNLQALLNGQGDTVTITAEQVQAVEDFLFDLTAVASPTLQQAIAEERAQLPPLDTFIGMTMDEARGEVIGYAIYLPLVQQP
jgi:hypothetical protein